MKEIMAYIDANYLRKLTLVHLAQEALVSPSYFSRVFKQMTGMTLTVYLNNKRFIKAKELLLETDYSIAQIAEAMKVTAGKVETEASGGINLKNIREYAATGVDYVSVGALIHQARSVDLSLKAL